MKALAASDARLGLQLVEILKEASALPGDVALVET